ncbi:DJ-1/PfpI family protein [Vibrio sp. NH-UV-68]|uniref:DJ-1/PfpI family protein n=1 Tax=unclassified Vibrio TaxID=2614977 RepID=UPI0036F223F5
MLKKILGIDPKLEPDGSHAPSKVSLMLATTDKTDYQKVDSSPLPETKSRVLVIMTEQKNMKMKNGKLFSTGNHPVETLVPMLHLQSAGYELEIATPTGKSAVIEMWAFPKKDEHVRSIYTEYREHFEAPNNLSELVSNGLNAEDYAAIFVPGGHGAMLGLPENRAVGSALRWAHDNDLLTISICHGPAAFFSTLKPESDFIYHGYRMAVFPDSVDALTPFIGYLPGNMPWKLSQKLKDFGVELVNRAADNTVCSDRLLITGASPLAANALGKLAVEKLSFLTSQKKTS